jgi:hypothetical protein
MDKTNLGQIKPSTGKTLARSNHGQDKPGAYQTMDRTNRGQFLDQCKYVIENNKRCNKMLLKKITSTICKYKRWSETELHRLGSTKIIRLRLWLCNTVSNFHVCNIFSRGAPPFFYYTLVQLIAADLLATAVPRIFLFIPTTRGKIY